MDVGVLSFITSTWVDFGLLFILALGNGDFTIILITWIQTQSTNAMLGRVMSMLMFSITGLVPLSQAISGAAVAGTSTRFSSWLALLLTVWAAFQPGLKTLSESLAAAPVGD